MITFKYRPKLKKKEKIKTPDNIRMIIDDMLNDVRTRELYQMIFTATAERNILNNPELNRAFGMRLERR